MRWHAFQTSYHNHRASQQQIRFSKLDLSTLSNFQLKFSYFYYLFFIRRQKNTILKVFRNGCSEFGSVSVCHCLCKNVEHKTVPVIARDNEAIHQ